MAFHRKDHFEVDLQMVSMVGQCISHPARLRVLLILREGGALPFAILWQALPLAQSTVSHHLSMLVRSGLLEVAEINQNTYYQLSEGCSGQIRKAIDRLETLL